MLEKISVIPIPTPSSSLSLLRVSLVILCLISSRSTLPIKEETANDFASLGSETGLSLLTCGNKSLTGCENLSEVNGATDGAFDAFKTLR